MKTVLVISSYVAASRVGSVASAFCLRRLGHEVITLPTTLMGRHPGWGDPGGGAVPVDQLHNMWKAIQAQNIKFDAVLTGYMGKRGHIKLAAEIICELRKTNPDLKVLVDPVMGDDGRLYIPEDRAEGICETLIPLADYITPNRYELAYYAGIGSSVEYACEDLPGVLVTSVQSRQDSLEIGAQWWADGVGIEVKHKKFETVPHGGGDALAGLFLAHLLNGKNPVGAMSQSVASVFKMMEAADKSDAGELPLIRTQEDWVNTPPLKAMKETP